MLLRLRVMQGGNIAYDELFHSGVNIIRGGNGSGKSTIADFIFYVLGGEFDDWKEGAKYCSEVQAEIWTPNGIITLRRAIAGKQEPIWIFFGNFVGAMSSPMNGWQRLSIRRHGIDLSFSQVFFRLVGIPEAPSQKSSNITSHQILRLMYADQRTPAPRLFRFESFDTSEIRSAVGDLMMGTNGYDLYETQIEIRQLTAELAENKRDLEGIFKVLPQKDGLISVSNLTAQIESLVVARRALALEIENVDEIIKQADLKSFINERQRSAEDIKKASKKLDQTQESVSLAEAYHHETLNFLEYLNEMFTKVKAASRTASSIDEIEFVYCPSCLKPLERHGDSAHCVLCCRPVTREERQSKYAHILYDTELQIRENKHLLEAKRKEIVELKNKLKIEKAVHAASLAFFVSNFSGGNAPRERYLAERNIKIGKISAEIERYTELYKLAEKIEYLNIRRSEINSSLDALDAKEKSLSHLASQRKNAVDSSIASIGAWILRSDVARQEEFISCNGLSLYYADDAISVDGKMNFAESSNVIAKNAAILSLFAAATQDVHMWHPRFVLFDNVEDKGMEMIRSHNFQNIMVKVSNTARCNRQLIVMTSMISPDLDNEEFCIGPKYTRDNRTLRIVL